MTSLVRLAVLVSAGAAVFLMARQTPPVDPLPQLQPDGGLMTVLSTDVNGTVTKNIGIDTSSMAYVNVGPSVPAVCTGPNNVFLQTYTNGAGQITIFSIWLCGANNRFQKPLLYKQVQ